MNQVNTITMPTHAKILYSLIVLTCLLFSLSAFANKTALGKPSNIIDWQGMLQLTHFDISAKEETGVLNQVVDDPAPLPAAIDRTLNANVLSFNTPYTKYNGLANNTVTLGIYATLNSQDKIGIDYNHSNFTVTPHEFNYDGYRSRGFLLRFVKSF